MARARRGGGRAAARALGGARRHDRAGRGASPGVVAPRRRRPPGRRPTRSRADDLYPDALPCLDAARGASACVVGIAGNQPTSVEAVLRDAGAARRRRRLLRERWGVEKPDPRFFAAHRRRDGVSRRTRSPTSAIASTTTCVRRRRPGWSRSISVVGRGVSCRTPPVQPRSSSTSLDGLAGAASVPRVSDLRIGLGVDAHALRRGRAARPRRRRGSTIPAGSSGHSDGDVVAHALTDALLGAAGLADIGALFPSDDETYRGADSLVLLAAGVRRVRAAGFELVNADCVVIGQEPRDRAAPGGDARAAGRGARRRGATGSTCGRRRPTTSASPGAARGSRPRRWRCSSVAERPARRRTRAGLRAARLARGERGVERADRLAERAPALRPRVEHVPAVEVPHGEPLVDGRGSSRIRFRSRSLAKYGVTRS